MALGFPLIRNQYPPKKITDLLGKPVYVHSINPTDSIVFEVVEGQLVLRSIRGIRAPRKTSTLKAED